jgi:hypothetical protein
VIYDFQYMPFSLGDILTWTVQAAVQADQKNWKPEGMGYRCRLTQPHPMQPFVLPGKERKYLGELKEAFRFNPLGLEVKELTGRQRPPFDPTDYARDLDLLRRNSSEGIDIRDQTRFFFNHVACHDNLNRHHAAGRVIPLLQAPDSIAKDTARLVAACARRKRWICIHIRFRGFDTRWDLSDVARNADPVVWYEFVATLARVSRKTHAILLMGELANYPKSFQAIPGVFSLRNWGGSVQNDLASILAADAFFGSSSGFATAANFSATPYAIFNVTPSGYLNYAVADGSPRLPFARPRQFLYGKTSSAGEMLKRATTVLPGWKFETPKKVKVVGVKPRPHPGLSAFAGHLLEQVDLNATGHRKTDLEGYLNCYQKLIPEAANSFEVQLARKLAHHESIVADEFIWRVFRRVALLRAAKMEEELLDILSGDPVNVVTAFPKAIRARELSPTDIRVRSMGNLLRRLRGVRCRQLSRRLFLVLFMAWRTYYRLFYALGSPYRSRNLNP